ncbi:MAG TPA: Ig-like domain-containing protein [Candidatus Acidoferrum sp.]|nr:Ig-like domain-containing protein [Candidatus Acidoferrum sp.]
MSASLCSRSPGCLCLALFGGLWLTAPRAAEAQAPQTAVRLSSITPGTECAQLVYNGDFQLQGPAGGNGHPNPNGWTRQADMFVGAGTNLVPMDAGVAALAYVSNSASVGSYQRTITLLPATDYVLSAYLWNMGDSANHVTTVIDLDDVPGEPQITLSYSSANADQGYFIYRGFNTTNTGTTVTLRVFYDGLTGTGAAASYYPLAAQWDNVAITVATNFLAPQAGGNLRPLVSLTNLRDGTNVLLETVPALLPLSATATDYDGTISTVEFYAGTAKVGQATASPYTILWTNPPTGFYQITAVATDNQGASTVSAPAGVSVYTLPQPVSLAIARLGTNIQVSWPTSATGSSLLWASNSPARATWRITTNAPALSNSQYAVTVSNAVGSQYFRLGPEVDASTLSNKLMMGYQGWFACTNDGSPGNQWEHWSSSKTPVATNLVVDFWPDISELGSNELFSTGMKLPDGSPARVYSAWNQTTVARHFKWMKDNHLDGVFLQRFGSELSNATLLPFRNQVTVNVRIGAETYGRVFAIMYDISGMSSNALLSTLTNDWLYLANTMGITNSPSYVRHKGKPVVAVWGFGFTDRPGTPQDATNLIAFFKAAGCTVMGGVPTYWRTLSNDSQTNPAWATAYRSFDIISPWSVGRYATTNDVDNFQLNQIIPDLQDTRSHGLDYMPVIFPGFSWHNLNGGTLNQTPRLGGAFYWRQVFDAIGAGCNMLYGAMFDEMNEGTSMLKMAPTANQLPVGASLVPLNVDGYALPSDWYLQLANQAGKMLRHEIPLQPRLPISP